MKEVPAFGSEGVVAEVLVTGSTPDVGGDAVFFGDVDPPPGGYTRKANRRNWRFSEPDWATGVITWASASPPQYFWMADEELARLNQFTVHTLVCAGPV